MHTTHTHTHTSTLQMFCQRFTCARAARARESRTRKTTIHTRMWPKLKDSRGKPPNTAQNAHTRSQPFIYKYMCDCDRILFRSVAWQIPLCDTGNASARTARTRTGNQHGEHVVWCRREVGDVCTRKLSGRAGGICIDYFHHPRMWCVGVRLVRARGCLEPARVNPIVVRYFICIYLPKTQSSARKTC